MKTVSNKLTCLFGMHDRDFFQPILITDNHLCLMADTDKITDHLKRRSEPVLYRHLRAKMDDFIFQSSDKICCDYKYILQSWCLPLKTNKQINKSHPHQHWHVWPSSLHCVVLPTCTFYYVMSTTGCTTTSSSSSSLYLYLSVDCRRQTSCNRVYTFCAC